MKSDGEFEFFFLCGLGVAERRREELRLDSRAGARTALAAWKGAFFFPPGGRAAALGSSAGTMWRAQEKMEGKKRMPATEIDDAEHDAVCIIATAIRPSASSASARRRPWEAAPCARPQVPPAACAR